MSPKSAYPKDYRLGSDNSGWLMRFKNKVQVWFTGGSRVPAPSFWKWRDIPKNLVAFKGKGSWRLENTNGSKIIEILKLGIFIWPDDETKTFDEFYLSRIQPWTRWHIALQWPLCLTWHVIYRQKNVVTYPTYKSTFGIYKMFAGYIGWKRDSDRIYKPSIFIGGNFE